MSTYEIEKNIPIPGPGGRNPRPEYPFAEMEVGDSFFVPKETNRDINQISARASAFGSATNKKFKCSTVDGGIRVWRSA